MAINIFLGGTCGNSTWRSSFTEDLVTLGVQRDTIFDPVVPDWTPECQAAEDAAKATASYNLFYLTNPQSGPNDVSLYSVVEGIMGLYDSPQNTVVVFDNTNNSGHVLKALTKTEKDLRKRFPQGVIFSTREEAIKFLASKLV